MDEAALMLEARDDAIARIATRVGYETTTAFSKAFKQHYSFSPGRYRARNGTGLHSSPRFARKADIAVAQPSRRRVRAPRNYRRGDVAI